LAPESCLLQFNLVFISVEVCCGYRKELAWSWNED